jgi:hypothetical protein
MTFGWQTITKREVILRPEGLPPGWYVGCTCSSRCRFLDYSENIQLVLVKWEANYLGVRRPAVENAYCRLVSI